MTWFYFFVCAFGLTAGLILPALFYLPYSGVSAKQGIAIAPVSTSFIIALAGLALHLTGVKIGSLPFYFIIVLISAVMGVAFRAARGKISLRRVTWTSLWNTIPMVLAVAVGLLATGYIFLRGVSAPESFLQVYDNSFHLSVIKSMSESSDFTVINVSPYLEAGASEFNPNTGTGFYPACWHIIAALIVQIASIPVTAAVNVTNFVFVAVVLPLGVQALVGVWTRDDFQTCACAAIATFAFTAFPWSLLYWGPVYPNLAAFCAVPAVAAVFQSGFSSLKPGEQTSPASQFVVGLLGIGSLAFLQPNAVFTLGIWLVPILLDLAVSCHVSLKSGSARARRTPAWVVRLGVLVLISLVWFACYKSSFMRGVVEYDWPSFTYPLDAVRRIVTRCYIESTIEIPLGILVIIGCWRCLSDKRYSGLFCCLIFADALFLIDAVSNGALRHLMTGFWYTDQHRVAAMASLFAVPVASLGISAVLQAAETFASELIRGNENYRRSYAPTIFLLIALLCLLYWPDNNNAKGEEELTPLGSIKTINGYMYSIADVDNNMTSEEADFLDRVKNEVGDDLVINNPYDGSIYGYPINDLNLLYRQFGLSGEGETDASRLIRSSVDSVASRDDVRSAVDAIGAKYLLVLDYGPEGREGADMPGHFKDDWAGLDSVRDDTPGFDIVLSSRDMRLYRISPCS